MFRSVIVLALCTALHPLYGQISFGTFETSLSFTGGSLFTKTEIASPVIPSSSTENSRLFAVLIARPGVFLPAGFELEPEISLSAMERSTPAVSISANLSYNLLPRRSRIAYFLLIGYGAGNAVPVANRMSDRLSNSFDITLINAGAGLKFFVARMVALRAEYRFQQYEYDYNVPGFEESYTVRNTWRMHTLLLGFSVFFR